MSASCDWIDGRLQDDGDDEPQQGVGRVHDRRADHHAHGVQIVGRARHQVARAPRLVVGERHLLEALEERIAQVVLDVARRTDQDPPHQEAEHRADQGDPEQKSRVHRELLPGDPRVEIVDGVLENPGGQELD